MREPCWRVCAKGKRGIISSLVAMGTNCGTLSATAIWAVMFFCSDREELVAWGWRVPFPPASSDDLCHLAAYEPEREPGLRKVNDAEAAVPVAKPDTSLGAMVKSKSFWLATGLRFVRRVTPV